MAASLQGGTLGKRCFKEDFQEVLLFGMRRKCSINLYYSPLLLESDLQGKLKGCIIFVGFFVCLFCFHMK